jgi:chemotaxis methyl-accepting protein methylase
MTYISKHRPLPLSQLPQINTGIDNIRSGSYFFRKNCSHQFPQLTAHMQGSYIPGRRRPYWVLSAGCGEGKEPASIVIAWLRLLKEQGLNKINLPLTVIAVDAANSELNCFNQGIIPFDEEADRAALPDLEEYFMIRRDPYEDWCLKPKKELRKRAHTVQMDLVSPELASLKQFTPEQAGFHAIFCNWVGYTIKDSIAERMLKPRLAELLRQDVPEENLFYEHGYWTGIV